MKEKSTLKVIACSIKPVQAIRYSFDFSKEAPSYQQQMVQFVDHVKENYPLKEGDEFTFIDHVVAHGLKGQSVDTVIFDPRGNIIHLLAASQVTDYLYGDYDGAYEVDDTFYQRTDAVEWAKAFLAINKEVNLATDEGAMIGWFASALMRGHDDGVQKTFKQLGIVPVGYEPYREGIPLRALVHAGILPPTAIYDTSTPEFEAWLEERAQQLKHSLAQVATSEQGDPSND